MITSGTRVLVATRNAGKVRELLPLLEAAGLSAESLADAGLPEDDAEDALEQFDTFEENALAKARWFAALLPGRVVLAEDSGLEVDALGGAPGVRSKRWTGEAGLEGQALDAANNGHLLKSLDSAAAGGRESRSARFVCAAALVWADGEAVARGATVGEILRAPRGAGGFGYDPLFFSSDLDRSFAEASREEKSRVSHRARAVQSLLHAVMSAGGDRVAEELG